MNISFYITKEGNCGFKFDTFVERDKFWQELGAVQQGAERIGNRTIRFYTGNVKDGYEVLLSTRNGQVNQAQEVNPNAPKSTVVSTTAPASAPRDTTTTNPFASMASNPTKPLPGLCPPPPAEMLASQQPVSPTPQVETPLETEGGEASKAASVEGLVSPPIIELITVPVPEVPGVPDPEPNVDKRKKEWRDWKARQK